MRNRGILRPPSEENSMNDRREREMVKITHLYSSRIAIPYGCLSLVALIVGALTTLVLGSVAIGIAILK
jgi:hypothetical protein